MQLDPSTLRALAQLDDRRFSAMLFTAARAVGLSDEEAKAAAANAPAFKRLLRNASEEDSDDDLLRHVRQLFCGSVFICEINAKHQKAIQ